MTHPDEIHSPAKIGKEKRERIKLGRTGELSENQEKLWSTFGREKNVRNNKRFVPGISKVVED